MELSSPTNRRPAPAATSASHAQYEANQRSHSTNDATRQANSKASPTIQKLQYEVSDPNGIEISPDEGLVAPYAQRAQSYPDKVGLPLRPGQLTELPKGYVPWWNTTINQPVRDGAPNLDVNPERLVLEAIEYSPQIFAMRIDPVIRETVILQEDADFDWVSFLDTIYDDKSDPIGSSLTAGPGRTRYRDNHLQSAAGVRKKLDSGARFDIAQRIGYQDTNSQFFVPPNQGTSRIELNFVQPLLRGRGETVSQSRIVLASLDQEIASADLVTNMQDHLVAVYESYWTLYRARANRQQKERLLERAEKTQQLLESRQGVDSLRRQILRAQAAVLGRRAEIVRCETAIRNAESRLRLLVNSPQLKDQMQVELLPCELPSSTELSVTLRGSVESALTHRPDIISAIKKLKSQTVKLDVAKNELLPRLDLAVGTYVAGLRGNGEINKAWVDQFSVGEPGYNVGLSFEIPLGNRAAKARHDRQEWELTKAVKEFEASVETAMTEVEIAVRETETAYQEMLGHYQAMVASENEAKYLEERWKLLPGNDQTISFLLEDLLDAQERVANEEADFVTSQVAYVMSVVKLKRDTGILLSIQEANAAPPEPAGSAQPSTQLAPQHRNAPATPILKELPE